MKYYRKQPVEAMQWDGDNQKEVSKFIGTAANGYCTKDDGYGNLNVCYMDRKKRKHLSVVPKFGWVVIEGKTLQFYKDETFRKTFKAAEEDSKGIDWAGMDKIVSDAFDSFDDIFKGFHGVPKEKIQEAVEKKTNEATSKIDAETCYKELSNGYKKMLDAWIDGGIEADANELQKYAVNEKDVESDTFDSVLDEMKELHAKKNADYGDAAHVNFLKYGPVASLSRLSEKMQRAEHILLSGKCEVKDEPLTATLIDMAITSAMLYIELKNQKK